MKNTRLKHNATIHIHCRRLLRIYAYQCPQVQEL